MKCQILAYRWFGSRVNSLCHRTKQKADSPQLEELLDQLDDAIELGQLALDKGFQ